MTIFISMFKKWNFSPLPSHALALAYRLGEMFGNVMDWQQGGLTKSLGNGWLLMAWDWIMNSSTNVLILQVGHNLLPIVDSDYI